MTNPFSANKFARDNRDTRREITDYPGRVWINRHTGAIGFTATTRPNNLAYLDWEVELHVEFSNVSPEELHK